MRHRYYTIGFVLVMLSGTRVTGGRGLEAWMAWQTHLDSWDALGEWGIAVHELENYFDVPVKKK